MIFVSVGSMLPFDRLIRAMDDWAGDNPHQDVYLQIGESDYRPGHAAWTRMLPIAEYRDRLRACSLFVAHAGSGSLLQALEEGKQFLMFPRRADLGEHTTDHQLHIAARFGDRPGFRVAETVEALRDGLADMTGTRSHPAEDRSIAPYASPQLLDGIRSFLADVRG